MSAGGHGSSYLEKKSSGMCTRAGCHAVCSETSLLCEPHRLDAARRVRQCVARRRAVVSTLDNRA